MTQGQQPYRHLTYFGGVNQTLKDQIAFRKAVSARAWVAL